MKYSYPLKEKGGEMNKKYFLLLLLIPLILFGAKVGAKTDWETPSTGSSTNSVPYTGATSDVDLGSKNLTTTGTLSGSNVAIGTTLQFRVSGGVSQYSVDGGTTWYAIQGDAQPVISSAATGTGNINIDGVSASHYRYSNGASAATYTPVITSAPPAGTERFVLLTVGGGAGVMTMTWTNVTWLGSAGAAATTTNKKSTYACIIPESGNAQCKIVAEAY
jgi:hypothetical protein